MYKKFEALLTVDKLTTATLTAQLPGLESTHFSCPYAVYREMYLNQLAVTALPS